ncbi:hypothetical protein [Carboxylicivirga sp. N1Y90]|uniref:hypothetical protein n=1 Tax=Carboxylicivirga fragile TaxID=3417571 RepID=UPI003D355B9A|nr:hypothetical protein [Marinilabiliaceae bacterium N1Y90]
MNSLNAFDNMRKMVKRHSGNVSILEDEIDLQLQMQYFKESKVAKKDLKKNVVLKDKGLLFSDELGLEQKRVLLTQLASVNKVEALRAIEEYNKQPDESLEEWGKLAFQESKMLIESSLLDVPPLFISTGLGGKGNKLRYFIVVRAREGGYFSEVQENLVRSEFVFAFKKYNAELESIEFYGHLATITGLIPLEAGLKDLFTMIVKNCNELGNFLDSSFMVSNVKKLRLDEIEKAIEVERQEMKDDKVNP